MKISYNWLKDYLDVNISAEEIGSKLTMAGFELEGIEQINDDKVLEVNVLSNRADCLGYIGLAREISIFLKNTIKIPEIKIEEDTEISNLINFEIKSPELCFKYMARIIKNVKIKPSPDWLRKKIESMGLPSINNIVDITNFVLMETGQPLHAFDLDKIDQKIIVRKAIFGEKFEALNNKEYELNSQMLVIADATKPIALAGIIGGVNSGISLSTQNILLESAYFAPHNIRKTAKELGISTESSFRFERGIDPQMVSFASDRASILIKELSGGKILKAINFKSPQHPLKENFIIVRTKRVEKISGLKLSFLEIKNILTSLNFQVEKCEENFVVKIPSSRQDIQREIDLIEEIIRIIGYDKIPISYPQTKIKLEKNQDLVIEKKIKNYLISCGLWEIISYSFADVNDFDKINLPQDSFYRKVISIKNPISKNFSIMRTCFLPTFLNTILFNANKGNNNVKFFEIGFLYFPSENEKLPQEIKVLSGAITGVKKEKNWNKKEEKVDFYYLKGIVSELLEILKIENVHFVADEHPSFHPYQNTKIMVGIEKIGFIGKVHLDVINNYGLKQEIYYFELFFDKLCTFANLVSVFKPLSKYPCITRDLSLILDKNIVSQSVIDLIKKNGNSLIKEVNVFDVYCGEQISKEKVNVSFSIVYQDENKTLEDQEVNKLQEKIIEKLKKDLKVEIRV
ncbi:MAG: phenylalanine--tRNA ligase subunit beta [bacterium]